MARTLFKLTLTFFSLYFLCLNFSLANESFEAWYNSLSEKQKVSQIFVSGLRGKKITTYEKELLKEWPLGGLIFFKRNFKNPAQFKKLMNTVEKDVTFSFADQEGGSVVRIGSLYDSPPPLAVGSLESKKVTRYLGKAYGSLLRDLNISSNLAPVVDIKNENKEDFISNRSYGSDAETVSKMSLEFSTGLLKSGTIPTLKHFPGIGGIDVDSHKKTPTKRSSLIKLLESDWKPYRVHAKNKIPFFVMSSHTRLIVDEQDYGIVTYSKRAIEKLRDITSESQVVMTDDLEMLGAKLSNQSFYEAAFKSFMAGHDLLLIGWSGTKLTKTMKYFLNQSQNQDFQNRLKVSLKRLHRLKAINNQIKKSPAPFSAHHSLRLSRGLNSKISEFLLSKEVKKNFYRKPSNIGKALVFSSDPVFTRAFDNIKAHSLLKTSNKNILNLCHHKKCVLHLTGDHTAKKIQKLLQSSDSHDFLVINSVDPASIPKDLKKNHQVFNVLTRSYKLGQQVEKILDKQSYTSLR